LQFLSSEPVDRKACAARLVRRGPWRDAAEYLGSDVAIGHTATGYPEYPIMIAYEELWRGIVTAVPDGIWLVDPQGRTIFNNSRMAELLRADTDSLSEQSCFECLFPEDVEEAQRQFAQGMAGKREPFDFRLRRNDGSAVWVSISCGPLTDASGATTGLLGLFSDITGRKIAEAKLHESEERFRNLADCAPVLLWLSGRDRLCEFFNQTWLAFTGRSLDQEIGNGWAQGVHPDDLQNCLNTYRSAFDAHRSFQMEYRLRRYDGEYRWVMDAGVPRFGLDGEFMGYVGSAVDITATKQDEERSQQLAHLQRLAAMGESAAAIAHELSQPLSSILANAEAAQSLLDAANPPLAELREMMSDIANDDRHASEVISRIRDFTRKREPSMQALDVNSVVADTLHLIAGEAKRRAVEIRTELTQGLPLAFGDRTQLQQVLINLTINGMEAMTKATRPAGYLTVRTRPGRDQVEVAVMDSGEGIAPDQLPRLFETFFTTKEEGMGLGLSLAQSIIQLHRGRIWAENNSARGATFHFTLPVSGDLVPDGGNASKTGKKSAASAE
jgi:PAS domain S-box-containing protein